MALAVILVLEEVQASGEDASFFRSGRSSGNLQNMHEKKMSLLLRRKNEKMLRLPMT
jgi:hypothetical protein